MPGGGGMDPPGGGINGGLCKGGAPIGGGTLGSKGIRPKGGRAAGGGPLIIAKGGTGVLSKGCLRVEVLAGGGAVAGKRSAGCWAMLLAARPMPSASVCSA